MKKGNLLIVDDESLIVQNLKLTLEEYAEVIFTAGNGLEAIKILDENKVHCVICDINMPKMNGVELIQNIRSKGNEVPFIFYTGHGNHELMLEAAKYGAYDFLNKPDMDGLEEVVSNGLNKGFTDTGAKVPDESGYLSEYAKLLKQLDDKN